MATSTEKVGELVAEYTGPPPPSAGFAELTVRSVAPALLNMGLLPEDPDDLDGLLDYLAAQCLLRRSDDAPPAALTLEAIAAHRRGADVDGDAEEVG
jgi:hypothetical protein